jgi:hypothetical protein
VQKKKRRSPKRLVGFLGVGLDNADEDYRLTRSEHFLLVGGSEETHERMQETAIKFAEALRRQGRTLGDTPIKEAIEMLRQARG